MKLGNTTLSERGRSQEAVQGTIPVMGTVQSAETERGGVVGGGYEMGTVQGFVWADEGILKCIMVIVANLR